MYRSPRRGINPVRTIKTSSITKRGNLKLNPSPAIKQTGEKLDNTHEEFLGT
jgi:hypothetical protein